MRNINDASVPHHGVSTSPRLPAAAACLLAALIVGGAGCERQRESAPAPTGSAATTRAADTAGAAFQNSPSATPGDCRVETDLGALESYFRLGARLAKGHDVSEEDFRRLSELPAYARLFAAMSPQFLNPGILQNVTRYAFAAENAKAPGSSGRHGREPKRQDLKDTLAWSRDRAADIQAFAQAFASERAACRAVERLAGYMDPSRLPDTLRVAFLIAGPDLRWLRDGVVIDGGLALAAGAEQLPRLLAAQMYRALAPPVVPLPHHAGHGEAAVAAACEMLRYEGVVGWLEGYPAMRFDSSHPLLGKRNAQQARWASYAQVLITDMDKMLAGLFADRTLLDEHGSGIDDLLRGNGGYAPLGFAMAALIATRLGEDRLRAASSDAAAFFRAFQEAAASEGGGRALPDQPWLFLGSVPALQPFSEQVFPELARLLARGAGR